MRISTLSVLLVAVICTWLLSVKAQHTEEGNARINYLIHAVTIAKKNDSTKVKLLNDLSFEYNKISPYDGIRYAMESLEIAEEIKWEYGIARANSCLGANYYSLSDYPNAYKYWLKALTINEELGFKQGIANNLHNIGNIFYSQKNYEKALEYYTRAFKKGEEINNKKLTTNSYTAIGNVYEQLKQYTASLEYHYKALALDEELKLKNNVAADQINIGSVYNEQGNYIKAMDILTTALKIKKNIGDKNGLAKTYYVLGSVYKNMYEHPEYKRETYLHKSMAYLDSAILISKEIGYLDNLQKSYIALSNVQELNNDSRLALYNYKQYIVIKDSIFSAEKQNEIFNLEKKAEIETKKREQEKAEEEKERTEFLHVAGISSFILILIGLVLLLRHKRVNVRVIEILGTISALVVFEFIELLLHGKIEELTHHNMTFTLLCLLAVAGVIAPIHHRIEHWMKQQIGDTAHEHS